MSLLVGVMGSTKMDTSASRVPPCGCRGEYQDGGRLAVFLFLQKISDPVWSRSVFVTIPTIIRSHLAMLKRPVHCYFHFSSEFVTIYKHKTPSQKYIVEGPYLSLAVVPPSDCPLIYLSFTIRTQLVLSNSPTLKRSKPPGKRLSSCLLTEHTRGIDFLHNNNPWIRSFGTEV